MSDIIYTDLDKKLIGEYEKRTGTRIMGREERYLGFKKMSQENRARFYEGIQRSLLARWSLDNDFDGDDDGWKEKILQENLSLLEEITREENKK